MIYYFLLNSENLMAENNGQFTIRRLTIDDLICHLFERDRVVRLLNGIDGISLLLQRINGIQRVGKILPFDAFFCTQSSLMNLRVGRTTTDSAKHNALNTHRIGRTKNRTYIMLTADVIEHHHQRDLIRLLVLRHTQAVHFGCR